LGLSAECCLANESTTMGADGSRKPFGLNEVVALIWFALDAGTHLSIELLYVLFTLVSGGAAYSKHPLAFIVSFEPADRRRPHDQRAATR
jgi:hypothetical protein